MKDYSVLDYLKGLLLPWKYPRINIPPEMPQEHITPESVKAGPLSPEGRVPEMEMLLEPDEGLTGVTGRKTNTAIAISISIPWAALTALILALAAQISLEPGQERAWLPGVIVYLMAMSALGFAIYRGEISLAAIPKSQTLDQTLKIRLPELLSGIFLAFLAFITSGGNRFSMINLLLILLAVGLVMRAFWITSGERSPGYSKLRAFFTQKNWTFQISPTGLLVGAVILLILFFRFYQLDSIPAEMNSDHAEKIIDVLRVQLGESMIFFPTKLTLINQK